MRRSLREACRAAGWTPEEADAAVEVVRGCDGETTVLAVEAGRIRLRHRLARRIHSAEEAFRLGTWFYDHVYETDLARGDGPEQVWPPPARDPVADPVAVRVPCGCTGWLRAPRWDHALGRYVRLPPEHERGCELRGQDRAPRPGDRPARWVDDDPSKARRAAARAREARRRERRDDVRRRQARLPGQ